MWLYRFFYEINSKATNTRIIFFFFCERIHLNSLREKWTNLFERNYFYFHSVRSFLAYWFLFWSCWLFRLFKFRCIGLEKFMCLQQAAKFKRNIEFSSVEFFRYEQHLKWYCEGNVTELIVRGKLSDLSALIYSTNIIQSIQSMWLTFNRKYGSEQKFCYVKDLILDFVIVLCEEN